MASTLGWDEEFRAANPLQFSPGPDDINMQDLDINMQDPPGPDSHPEQVIDPALIGLTATGQPTAPTVPKKNTKKPTKTKGPGKSKSKPAAQKGKNASVMPDDIEPPEPTTTVEKPQP
jgi:hypothetical protein